MESPSNRYDITNQDLDAIRKHIDWKALFHGLSLNKEKARSKKNDWWAHSPFHEEKTPSFHMGPGAIWYDFSIGEGGGPIELIQRLQCCDCYAAGKFILEKGWSKNSRDIETCQTDDNVVFLNVDARAGYVNPEIRQDLLPMTRYHEYLSKRGISEKVCQRLGIGYLPQGRSPLRGRIIFQVRDHRPKKGQTETVILSHFGRAVLSDQKPKYLFYEGFKKSAELYGQEQLYKCSEASDQISETGYIVLTEGPFDLAKAYEAGLRNIVACFGSSLSKAQANTLKRMCEAFDCKKILVVFDRDHGGYLGSEKASVLISDHDLKPLTFDWDIKFKGRGKRPVSIPENIRDLGDFSTVQIRWLRKRRMI